MFSIEATSSKQSKLDRSIPCRRSSKSIFKIQQGYIFPNLPSLNIELILRTAFHKPNTYPFFLSNYPLFLFLILLCHLFNQIAEQSYLELSPSTPIMFVLSDEDDFCSHPIAERRFTEVPPELP